MGITRIQRRKIDGFQNRCLRVIWGIKPAFVSRVSNAKVLEVTGEKPLTQILEKQQLLLYGRAARQADNSLMRESVFCPGSLRPATEGGGTHGKGRARGKVRQG